VVAANVVLPGGLTALPTSISWFEGPLRGERTRRKGEEGRAKKRDGRKHPPI